MATGDTYVNLGTTFAIATGKPATEDQTGYEALTWTAIEGVLSLPERGDASTDVSEPALKDGRVEHFNGAVDGGARTIPFKFIEADAGQIILIANANTNTVYSFRETDSDTVVDYYYGRLADLMKREATPDNFKGYSVTVRTNSATVTV